MYEIKHDSQICKDCKTYDCLVRCQHMCFDLMEARTELFKLINGDDSRVLFECLTCYACEEYCPHGNHPLYRIVQYQENRGIKPVPDPLTKEQLRMMGPRGRITPTKLESPVIDMCAFPMLIPNISGKLFKGASTISGNDIFCNIMWLHFAKNSVIRERLPKIIDNIQNYYLNYNKIDKIICFHDECYGAYTHFADAFGIDVPFKVIHFFEYLYKRLDELKKEIVHIEAKVAYQRPCSNRLIPETAHWVDDIFKIIGVERVEREYDRKNALCCGGIAMNNQWFDFADDLQKRNLDDMQKAGVTYCVFNCPACLAILSEAVAERGIIPILMGDLCKMALN